MSLDALNAERAWCREHPFISTSFGAWCVGVLPVVILCLLIFS